MEHIRYLRCYCNPPEVNDSWLPQHIGSCRLTLVELVKRLPQLIDPRIPLSLVEVAGHRLAQIHPGLKVTERPRLA